MHEVVDLAEVRRQLEEIERKLIPLLLAIQRALGKEPSVITREQRRQGLERKAK